MPRHPHLNDFRNYVNRLRGKTPPQSLYELPAPDFIELSNKLSEPQREIFESDRQVNLFLAGQGAGKPHLGGAISCFMVFNFPQVRGIIAANTYRQLTKSTLFRIREFWKKECAWKEYNEQSEEGEYVVGKIPPPHFNTEAHNYDSYANIIAFKNGAVIYYGSLDNYKALDGQEAGWAILDETKDTREEAVKEVILGRLRQRGLFDDKGQEINPLYLLTSPAKTPWLSEWFALDEFESEIMKKIFSETDFFSAAFENKKAVISSAYHNQKNLPPDYLPNQKRNLSTVLQDMLIYGSPFSKSGGEFYKCFDRALHVKPCPYKPELPLHVSLDFNVHPYITLVIAQLEDKTIRFIDEICLESPRNNTEKLCRELERKYGTHQAGLFVYGDASGKRQDTRSEKGFNDYSIVRNTLKKLKPSFRVPSKNPNIVPRGNFINQILESEHEGLRLEFDPKCKELINDLSCVKEAGDGTKRKDTESKNGITYQKYGHTSDAMDYLIMEAFKALFLIYTRGGKEKREWITGLFKRNSKY